MKIKNILLLAGLLALPTIYAQGQTQQITANQLRALLKLAIGSDTTKYFTSITTSLTAFNTHHQIATAKAIFDGLDTYCVLVTDNADGDVSGVYSNLQIKANAVGAAEIVADAVGSSEIEADAVGSSEIAADAVGASEIAADAVGSSEIAGDAVGSSEIVADAVGPSEIAAGAVGSSEIADGNIALVDMGSNSVDSTKAAALSLSDIAGNGWGVSLWKVPKWNGTRVVWARDSTGSGGGGGSPGGSISQIQWKRNTNQFGGISTINLDSVNNRFLFTATNNNHFPGSWPSGNARTFFTSDPGVADARSQSYQFGRYVFFPHGTGNGSVPNEVAAWGFNVMQSDITQPCFMDVQEGNYDAGGGSIGGGAGSGWRERYVEYRYAGGANSFRPFFFEVKPGANWAALQCPWQFFVSSIGWTTPQGTAYGGIAPGNFDLSNGATGRFNVQLVNSGGIDFTYIDANSGTSATNEIHFRNTAIATMPGEVRVPGIVKANYWQPYSGSALFAQGVFNLVRSGVTGKSTLNFNYNGISDIKAYIDLDYGSGELKHWASSGGYYQTFYSNNAEIFRIQAGVATVTGALSVTGAISGASAAISGNATVGGTLGVTGNASFTGQILATGHSTSNYRQQVGTFYTQSYGLNNGFLSDNAYYNGSSWTRASTGYAGGFQFYNGQTLVHNANTGSGNFTQTIQFKTDHTGAVALGGDIASTAGSYTGAKVLIEGDGQVGIGTVSIDAAALVETSSTTKGTIPFPKMTTTQFTTISSPPEGLFSYSTTAHAPMWKTQNSSEYVTVASKEKDITGTADLITATTYVAGAQVYVARLDANSNNIDVTLGAGMLEGFDYVFRCTRNGTNTITFNADTSYSLAIDGDSALTPTTLTAGAYKIYYVRRHGTVIYIR